MNPQTNIFSKAKAVPDSEDKEIRGLVETALSVNKQWQFCVEKVHVFLRGNK